MYKFRSESEDEKAKTASRTGVGPEIRAGSRRKSMMYNEDDSGEDSDNETEIIETDVHLEEPVAQPPQPKPRKPIEITRPAEALTRIQMERDEVSLLQNPTRNESSEVMEPVVVKGRTFQAIDNFEPQEAGDLALRKGEFYETKETRSDGWWLVMNGHGQVGLVPKTYLMMVEGRLVLVSDTPIYSGNIIVSSNPKFQIVLEFVILSSGSQQHRGHLEQEVEKIEKLRKNVSEKSSNTTHISL